MGETARSKRTIPTESGLGSGLSAGVAHVAVDTNPPLAARVVAAAGHVLRADDWGSVVCVCACARVRVRSGPRLTASAPSRGAWLWMCESCAPVEFLSASWRHVSLVATFIISWIGVSGGGLGGGRSASRRPASATSSSSPSGVCSCASALRRARAAARSAPAAAPATRRSRSAWPPRARPRAAPGWPWPPSPCARWAAACRALAQPLGHLRGHLGEALKRGDAVQDAARLLADGRVQPQLRLAQHVLGRRVAQPHPLARTRRSALAHSAGDEADQHALDHGVHRGLDGAREQLQRPARRRRSAGASGRACPRRRRRPRARGSRSSSRPARSRPARGTWRRAWRAAPPARCLRGGRA